jgi:hypothetical protein
LIVTPTGGCRMWGPLLVYSRESHGGGSVCLNEWEVLASVLCYALESFERALVEDPALKVDEKGFGVSRLRSRAAGADADAVRQSILCVYLIGGNCDVGCDGDGGGGGDDGDGGEG